MAKGTEQDIEKSSAASSLVLATASATSQSAASTKPTSRSSSTNTTFATDFVPSTLPRPGPAKITPMDASTALDSVIPDSDDFGELVSSKVAASPRAGRGAALRKTQRRSSRFVEDPELASPGSNCRNGEMSQANNDALRTISGATLFQGISDSKTNLLEDSIDALNMDWKLDSPRKNGSPRKKVANVAYVPSRRKSGRFSTALDTAKEAASTLGKRGRDAFDFSVDKVKTIQRKKNSGQRLTEGERLMLEEYTKKREMDEHRENTTLRLRPGKKLEDLPPLPKGWSYNLPEEQVPAAKRVKTDKDDDSKTKDQVAESDDEQQKKKPSSKTVSQPRRKQWLKQGLYVGQKQGYDPRRKPAQNEKRLVKQQADEMNKENSVLPRPMFAGEKLIERGRNFKLPFDIFSPLPAGQPKPEEWRKIRSNRFYGDALYYWQKQATLPQSRCDCDKSNGSCGDNCINRALSYECDSSNCNVDPDKCTNRAFASLKERYKKGSRFDVGVEVLKTENKGFGVRACRTFDEDQIILEYAGEIITEDECQRRMKEDYKDKESFYLMEFDQGMIIDATKGSMARFVNHSCEPNCEMRKWIVDKKPRMALFALRPIMTGEELTYDYNFEPTGEPQPCHCGAGNCRGVIGPRTTKVQDKQRVKEQQLKTKEKAKKIIAEKKQQSAPKAESTKTLESKASSAKNLVSNALAGTKRKFKELISGSSSKDPKGSKDSEASNDFVKPAEERGNRLQKRQRTSQGPTSFPGLEARAASTLSLSSRNSSEERQPLLQKESLKSISTKEKRVTSTSTDTTTLVNDSTSTIEQFTPVTEQSASDTKVSADSTQPTASPVDSKGSPRSKYFVERKTSTQPAALATPETVHQQSPRKTNTVVAASSIEVEPESRSFDEHLGSSSDDKPGSPEHKGSRNPWLTYKVPHPSKKTNLSKVTGQGTLEGYFKRSDTVKKVTEVLKKEKTNLELGAVDSEEHEGRNASEMKRGKSVRAIEKEMTDIA